MTRATTIPETITLHVPFRVVKRGGRKEMLLPPGTSTQRARVDSTLVKALARAFRWKRLLEQGDYGSQTELATAEKINLSYLGRVLRLTLLAPDIVEAILDGRQPSTWQLELLLKQFPGDWSEQRKTFLSKNTSKSKC